MKVFYLAVFLISAVTVNCRGSEQLRKFEAVIGEQSQELEEDIFNSGIDVQLEEFGADIAEQQRALITNIDERTEDEQRGMDNNFQRTIGGECGTKRTCEALGFENNVKSGCLPKDQECHGTRVKGRKFCKQFKTCSCCIPTPTDQCDKGRRLHEVEIACENILDPICEAQNGTGRCEQLHDDCINLFCNMLDRNPEPSFDKEPKEDGACDCSWSSGGCQIKKPPPANKACYCQYHVLWRCTGDVVPCKDIDSQWCKDPVSNIETCKQGGGDCGGY